MSVWSKAGWVKEEDEINNKAFDNDWEFAKDRLPKAIKDDETEKENIRKIMRWNYNLIRWTYKWWASYSTISNIWCITENNF